jgi:hypothetical protein
MAENLSSREQSRPDPCQTYGHIWQATDKVPGQYRCTICKAIGYCPGCVVAVPVQATMMFCKRHAALGTSTEVK